MTMTTPQPQQGAKHEAKPVTAPVDTSQPLKPTHALSITHTKHHTIIIQDLTPSLSSLFSHKHGLAIEEATKLIDATPAPPTVFTLKKENLLCTHLTAHDREGKEVAEWKNPILSLHASKVTIKFLGQNEENKLVEVNPIGHDRVSESFKLNNKTYIWEAESKYHQNKHLYEIIETSNPAPPPATSETTTSAAENGAIATLTSTVKKAREIARYTQKHVHGHGHAGGKEGLLVIDTERIGALEGVLTLCAMLELLHRADRFEKAYDNVVGLVG